MRSWVTVLGTTLLVPLLLASTCLTVDPPLPDRLSAPSFTHVEIITHVYDGELRETIHLQWIPDTTDTISISQYQILRQPDIDSFITPITNIPDSITDIYDPVYLFNFEDRSIEHSIAYWIFAYDSLGRAGDTSSVFAVQLAREVNLLIPTDTFTTNLFYWEITPIQLGPATFHAFLWRNNSVIWRSDTLFMQFIGSTNNEYTRSLPDSLLPLASGEYFWGVPLTISGGVGVNDPASVAITKFYAE